MKNAFTFTTDDHCPRCGAPQDGVPCECRPHAAVSRRVDQLWNANAAAVVEPCISIAGDAAISCCDPRNGEICEDCRSMNESLESFLDTLNDEEESDE
jgi:hypothetical protein